MGCGASWPCSASRLLCALTMVVWCLVGGRQGVCVVAGGAPAPLDIAGPANEEPWAELTLASGSRTPGPKPVQVGAAHSIGRGLGLPFLSVCFQRVSLPRESPTL